VFPQVLSQCQALLHRRRRVCEAVELFHEIVELRYIVIDIFVAVLWIEFACQFSGFVGRTFFRGGFDVVADLIAGR
jgi:hypothetical protein